MSNESYTQKMMGSSCKTMQNVFEKRHRKYGCVSLPELGPLPMRVGV
jgi:hypothetical protein